MNNARKQILERKGTKKKPEEMTAEELEAYIDRAIEKGRFEFSADESKFLENFDVEIKEEITNHLSMYGYKVDWCNYTITISFEEG